MLLSIGSVGAVGYSVYKDQRQQAADDVEINAILKQLGDDFRAVGPGPVTEKNISKLTDAYGLFTQSFRDLIPPATFETRITSMQQPPPGYGRLTSMESNHIVRYGGEGGDNADIAATKVTSSSRAASTATISPCTMSC